jgi:hypothetical protein
MKKREAYCVLNCYFQNRYTPTIMLIDKSEHKVRGLKKIGVVLGKILLGLFILCLIALGVIIFVILPQREVMGAQDQKPFSAVKGMHIEKKTPSGVTYSINNGAATFRLDAADY